MSKKKSHYGKAGLVFEELEPKLLLSADPLAVAADAGDGDAVVQELVLDNNEAQDEIVLTEEEQSFPSVREELVIIDSRAPNYQQLHNDLIRAQQEGRNIHVVVLDTNRDGIEQINEALATHSNLDAVHIVSHGDDGQLKLGSTQLDKTTLRQRSTEITQWKDTFSEDGDLLIYGCNFAETAEGKKLINALSYLTATDVAASDDLTGSSLLGGDWELEYEAGDIETSIAFSEDVQQDWYGTLEGAAPAAEEQESEPVEEQQQQHAQADIEVQQAVIDKEEKALEQQEQEQQAAIAEQQRRELVFIDESVNDFQEFMNDLQADSDDATVFEIILLDGNGDGIDQIGDILSEYNDIDALHIISHGDDGAVKLGNTWLNTSNLDQHSESLSAWASSLDQDADILIYGCNLAESAYGEQFIDELSQLTGADVAASDDLTGHATLGGDWELEYAVGSIETAVAVDETAQASYQGILNTYIVSNTNATGAGSLHQAIIDANTNAGVTDTITFNIPGAGPHVINLTGALPVITDTVIINGTSEPDYAGDPVVRIDGTSAGAANGLTFAAGSDKSVVRGLMITNFTGYGIQINPGADRIRIVNNWIGTTGTGSTGVGNGNTGINIQGANTIVGGSGVNDGNVITNNSNEGISITGAGATGTVIQGNIIGLDPDGSTGSGNTDVGIAVLTGAHNTIIGGTVAAERNIISNNIEGIEINSNDNIVQGNYIGTDVTGMLDRGNRSDDGVEIQNNATGNLIGGTDPGAGNLIAFNARDGVYIVNGANNTVLGNIIHSNTGLGIDLGVNGVTANDANDVDPGANELQNFPVLSSVLTNANNTVAIDGTLNSTAATDFRIEFFASAVADASGNGEAERYLGSVNVTTDAGGNATFSVNLTEVVANGEFITATATVDNGGGSYGNTSELAQNVSATLTTFAPTLHDWYDDAWDYRKDIVIDSSKVDAKLTDFPVLINLNADADLAAFAQADGDDILFTSADGTKLAHEIESFDAATGALTVWVKTDLSAVADTRLFLYYGNAVAANQQDAANVWDSSYIGVWHLNDTPTGAAGDINDSTANDNDGTTEGGMNAADSVAAQIGTGLDFDEVDDLIRMPDSASLDSVADEATIELWIWFDNAADGDHQFIMSSSNRFSGGDGYEWASQAGGNHFFYPDAMTPDGNYNLGSNPFTDQQWQHLAVTLDFASRDVDVYVDGVAMTFNSEGVPANWATLTSSDDWLWAGNPDRASRYFDGMMDEIRVSDVVRSQAWIQTSINNQSDPSTFFTLGVAESSDLTLTAINEDDNNPPGDTVLAILNSGAGNRITDVDAGALEGIAVVGVDDSNGQWQYDATGGGTWVAFGAVSDASAVLLDTTASVRFVPNADYNGSTGDLTFRAWDQTSGANGDTGVNVGVNGGTTAFSAATATVAGSVSAINDAAPVANDDSYTVAMDQTLTVNALSENATAADLSAAWTFEEGSGTSTGDATGNGNDGTLVGGTAWTTSSRTGDAALVFDGVDDYVQTTATSLDLSTATSFTLSAWFNTDTTAGQQHILWQGVSTENGWGTPADDSPTSSEMHLTVGRHNLNDKITFFMGYHDANPASIDITSASDFTDTSGWHQAVVVVTDLGGGTLQADLYVDGVLEGSDTGTQIDRSQWDSDLRIGRGGSAGRYYDGAIDEIGIYNRDLTTAEVIDLYQTGVIANDTDIDGDILTASLVAGPANGVLALEADGSFTYTPNLSFTGTDSFTYTVNDGTVDSNVANVTITVTGDNDAPVNTVPGTQTVLEDTQTAIAGISVSDTDAGAGIITTQLSVTNGVLDVTVAGAATISAGNNGTNSLTISGSVADINATLASLQYTGNLNVNGINADTLVVLTDDQGNTGSGGAKSDTDNIQIDITPVNDVPVATTNTVSTTEDNSYSFSAADFTFSDVEGDSLVAARITNLNLAGGTLTYGGGITVMDGNTLTALQLDTLVYTPAANANGSPLAWFDFTVNDAGTGVITAQMNIDVTAGNDLPQARDDRIGLVFDGVDDYVTIGDYAGLVVSTNMTMEAWIRPTGLGTGTKIIVNKEGEYEMGMNATTGEVMWAFDNIDPGWSWHNTGYFVQADEWTHLAVSYNNGVVNTYANGVLVDTYNGSGAITDNYPAMNQLQIGGRENTTLQRFDGQIDEVRLWNSTRTQLDIQTNMGSLLNGAEPGLIGNWRFDEGSGFTVEDQSVLGHHGTLADGVTAGEMPSWQGYVVNEEATLNVAAVNGVLANDFDIDGDPLTALLVAGPANAASFTLNLDGSFDYTPTANFTGVDTFTYRANDGSGNSNIASVSIRVAPVNDVPVATANTVSTTEDTAYTFSAADFTFTDVEGDALVSATITNLSLASGTLTHSGGIAVTSGDTLTAAELDTLIYTPVVNTSGTPLATFDFTVNDAGTGVTAASMSIDVTAVNDLPVATANTVATIEDVAYSFSAADFTYTDVEGDALVSATITNLSLAGGTLTHSSGTPVNNNDTLTAAELDTLVYTPAAATTGAPLATFDFAVNDTGAGVAVAQMSINVAVGNNVPVATANTVVTTEDNAYTFSAADFTYTDTESDALVSATLTNLSLSGGTLSHSSGTPVNSGDTLTAAQLDTLIYTPAANNNGTPLATFDFTVNDAGMGVVAAQMSINVTAQPDAAMIGGVDTGVVTEDDDPDTNNLLEVSGSLTIIDPDAGEATFNPGAFGGTYGVVTLNAAGDWDYAAINSQPAIQGLTTGDTLTDTITISSVDGTTHDIVITIMGTNDAPVAGNDVASVNEGGSVIIDVAATDSDVDNALDLTSISITSLPANGNVVVNGDGTITYTHNGGETLTDSFSYTISDVSAAVSNTATVTLSVNPVNDAPTTSGVADVSVNEDSASTGIDLHAAFDDVDNLDSELTYAIIGNTNIGLFSVAGIDNSTGQLTLDYATDMNGLAQISVRATDPSGSFVDTLFNVTVNAVNDNPVLQTNTGMATTDSAPATISSTELNATDVDHPDTELLYTVTALPANGELRLNGAVMALNGTFTQADLDNNLLTYVPTGAVTADQFGFTVSDSAGGAITNNTFNILVQFDQNDDEGTGSEPPPNDDEEEEETTQEETAETESGGLIEDAGGYGGGFVPLGSSSVPPAPAPVLSIEPAPAPEQEQAPPVEEKEQVAADVEQQEATTFTAVQVKSIDALWSAIDKMKQEMAEAEDGITTPVEFQVAAAKSTGVVLTAGVVAWILRSGALLSSLMSTIPLWKGYDPLPILAYKDDDEKDKEEDMDEHKIPTSLEELRKLKKLMLQKQKAAKQVDVDSLFGGSTTRE